MANLPGKIKITSLGQSWYNDVAIAGALSDLDNRKMDKPSNTTDGNLVVFDTGGRITDSGTSLSSLTDPITTFNKITVGDTSVNANIYNEIKFKSLNGNLAISINNNEIVFNLEQSTEHLQTFIAGEDYILPATLENLTTCAVIDPDNNMMYVVGHFTAGSANNRVYRINMLTGERVQLANYPISIATTQKGAYYNGQIYIFGGMINSSSNTNRSFRYNIANNTWTELPVASINLGYHSIVAVGNIAYILDMSISGTNTTPNPGRILRFDMENNVWLSDIPSTYRRRTSANCVVGTDIYSFGGYSGTAATNPAYKLDTLTNTITPLANLPRVLWRGGAVPDDRGNIIIQVGQGSGSGVDTTQLWRYNIATNSYEILPTRPSVGYNDGWIRYKNTAYMPGASDAASIHSPIALNVTDVYIKNVSRGDLVKSTLPITNKANNGTFQDIPANTDTVIIEDGELWLLYDRPLTWKTATANIQTIPGLTAGTIRTP